MTAVEPGPRSRRWPRIFGIADGVVILFILFSLIVVPIAVRAQESRHFSNEADTISDESEQVPLATPRWTADDDVAFGVADLPGPSRTIHLGDGQYSTNATVVGGHGQGVVVMEVTPQEGDTANEAVDRQVKLLIQAGKEMDVDLGEELALVEEQGNRYRLLESRRDMSGDFSIDDDFVRRYTHVRTKLVEADGRTALVVGFWPAFEKDPVTDRVARTADFR